MEIDNEISIEKNLSNTRENQNSFIESMLGKAINTAVDIGIRAIFPEFIEDQIIKVKENLLEHGLKDGIKKSVTDTIDMGKSAIGIFTGEFENISQMQKAIQRGGLIDGISSLLDYVIDNVKNTGAINKNIANTIKQGKNAILNNVEKNIENNFVDQLDYFEKIEGYIKNWKKGFEDKDFDNMEKESIKINKEIKNLIPLENILIEARRIENLQNLIKNNGKNFDLSYEQLELASKLV